MGIAQLRDRFSYLEEHIEENGGVEHLKESPEWEEVGGDMAKDIPYFDLYMHKSNYFRATVHKKGEDLQEVSKIEVSFERPRHHFSEDEPLPPIYEDGDREEYREYHFGKSEETEEDSEEELPPVN